MKRHWKKIVGVVVALIVVVVAGSFIYAKVLHKSDPAFGQSDVDAKLDSATTSIAISASTSSSDPSTSTPADLGTTAADPPAAAPSSTLVQATSTDADGKWTIQADSEVGYRVDESINGFDTTANGRTKAITGSMTVAGTTISEGQFTVDMATFKSDETRRDAQFNGRIMDVATYPTATFVLAAPIEFGQVPADGQTVTATATGDLTLHGTTKPVTFDVQATYKNGLIGVLGQIPIVFADYGIPNPSIATVKTEDNGLLEFVLVLERQ